MSLEFDVESVCWRGRRDGASSFIRRGAWGHAWDLNVVSFKQRCGWLETDPLDVGGAYAPHIRMRQFPTLPKRWGFIPRPIDPQDDCRRQEQRGQLSKERGPISKGRIRFSKRGVCWER